MSELTRGVGMTEQTDAAEVEALAEVLGDIRVAEARQADWWTDDIEHSLLIRVLRGECVPWAAGLLASDWLAAREAAAEVRALRDAADALSAVSTHPVGWLRDRADRIAARAAAAAAGGGGEA